MRTNDEERNEGSKEEQMSCQTKTISLYKECLSEAMLESRDILVTEERKKCLVSEVQT